MGYSVFTQSRVSNCSEIGVKGSICSNTVTISAGVISIYESTVHLW